ncbi:MAG: hypothetical protein AB7N54_10790 [Alphaproteobacteria bacterium]
MVAAPQAPAAARHVQGGVLRGIATALAAGVLFAATTVALTTAAAWAIVSLLDLPRWLAAPLETFAVVSAIGIGAATGWRAWQRERQVVGDGTAE